MRIKASSTTETRRAPSDQSAHTPRLTAGARSSDHGGAEGGDHTTNDARAAAAASAAASASARSTASVYACAGARAHEARAPRDSIPPPAPNAQSQLCDGSADPKSLCLAAE